MARASLRPLAVGSCAIVLVACQLGVQPSSPGIGRLATWEPGAFCPLAELLPATVRVDPDADPPTWMEGPELGQRTNLEWPVGFSLRLTDGAAEVVDDDGIVAARDGDEDFRAGGGQSARGQDWFSVCSVDGRSYADDSER